MKSFFQKISSSLQKNTAGGCTLGQRRETLIDIYRPFCRSLRVIRRMLQTNCIFALRQHVHERSHVFATFCGCILENQKFQIISNFTRTLMFQFYHIRTFRHYSDTRVKRAPLSDTSGVSLRVIPGGYQVDGLPPASTFTNFQCNKKRPLQDDADAAINDFSIFLFQFRC